MIIDDTCGGWCQAKMTNRKTTKLESRIAELEAKLRRVKEGSDISHRPDKYEQLGDLIQACKLLDANQKPQLKRAIAERLNELYELNLPLDSDSTDSDAARR